MITKIIACADIHIRNLRRMDEYKEQLNKFIDNCTKIVEENGKNETRIVLVGDIFHNYIEISAEAYAFASWFLRKLDNICKTYVIAGNHDISNNLSRLDPLSVVFSTNKFKNVVYLDGDLQYQSGTLADDNVTWVLYSVFDNFSRPNIEEALVKHPNNTVVGLFHGMVLGSKTDTDYVAENGVSTSLFDGTNFSILGHIHKRQELTYNGIPIVYCGSLIQQDHGENTHGHGYCIWDVENESVAHYDIDNENYGFYTFTIDNIDDITNDKETIINL